MQHLPLQRQSRRPQCRGSREGPKGRQKHLLGHRSFRSASTCCDPTTDGSRNSNSTMTESSQVAKGNAPAPGAASTHSTCHSAADSSGSSPACGRRPSYSSGGGSGAPAPASSASPAVNRYTLQCQRVHECTEGVCCRNTRHKAGGDSPVPAGSTRSAVTRYTLCVAT